jgi:hypothetical protein
MVGNANFIEEAMKLSNDCRNLRGQITGIHGDRAQIGALDSGLLMQNFEMYGCEVARNGGSAVERPLQILRYYSRSAVTKT